VDWMLNFARIAGVSEFRNITSQTIKIGGYDAIITSNLPDRLHKRDVLFAIIAKDNKLFSIRTECIDHERVWNSFKFEK
jgi:hypothetical protein